MRTSGVILLSTLFCGIGFAAGYVVSRQKYLKLADKEIQSMKDKLPEHDDNLLRSYGIDPSTTKASRKIASAVSKSSATITPEVIEKTGKDRLKEELNSKPLNNVDYSKLSSPYKSSSPKLATPEQKKKAENQIRFITEDDYYSAESDGIELVYYADGMISDVDGNLIINPKAYIGDVSIVVEKLKEDGCVWLYNIKNKEYYSVQLSEKEWKDIASENQKSAIIDLDRESNDD